MSQRLFSSVFPQFNPVYKLRSLPSFSASVLRLWIQLKGGLNNNQWVLLRDQTTPSPLDQLTSRQSYGFLSGLDAPPHRCLAKFASLGFTVSWQYVWQNLDLWQYTRSVQDTAWLYHGILPTADRLVHFRMAVAPECFCGTDEPLVHLFTSFPFAIEVFDWFATQFRRFRPSLRVSFYLVLPQKIMSLSGMMPFLAFCVIRSGRHATVVVSTMNRQQLSVPSKLVHQHFVFCCACINVIAFQTDSVLCVWATVTLALSRKRVAFTCILVLLLVCLKLVLSLFCCSVSPGVTFSGCHCRCKPSLVLYCSSCLYNSFFIRTVHVDLVVSFDHLLFHPSS